MTEQRAESWSRREFVGGLTTAGTAGLLGMGPWQAAAEPSPETATLRLVQNFSICGAPQYLAEEYLRSEGFTEVQYTKVGTRERSKAMASGEADMTMGFAATWITRVDAGDPIVLLAGVHVGCFELFGTDRVRSIRDLRGKTVAVPGLESSQHVFLASMLAYVGLNPQKDVKWVTHPFAESMRLLADGKIDAYMGWPPEPLELRERKIGHVVVNSMMDRPWSQYFCCIVVGNQEFVRKHPVATKRALRAILKGTDICALEPERAARLLVDRGHTPRYDHALQTMKDIPYAQWRELDPEDTVRFYALRLREAGMVRASPKKIIAQGTDWRFLNELKKELKG
jgi:NitT/TauT family transport system substrate-binding protein